MKNTIERVELVEKYARIHFIDKKVLNYFYNDSVERKDFVSKLKPMNVIEFEPKQKDQKFPPFTDEIKVIVEQTPELDVTAHLKTKTPYEEQQSRKDALMARMNGINNSVKLHEMWLSTGQMKKFNIGDINLFANKIKKYIETGEEIK